MRTLRPRFGVIATLSFLALVCACSSSSSSGTTDSGGPGGGAAGSCTIQSGKSCFDYPGSAFTASSVQQTCAKLPTGVYSASACATADRTGSCEVMVGSSTEQSVRYYSSGFTTDQAQTNCTAQSGTFTPG